MNPFEAVLTGDFFHGHMLQHPHPRSGIINLAGIGFRVSDEFLHGFPGSVLPHDNAVRISRQIQDIGEILQRIPGGFHNVRQAQDAHRNLRQGIAIWFGRGRHGGRSHGAASPGFVFDDDRFSQMLACSFRQNPKNDIRASAGDPGNNNGHRFDRKVRSHGAKGEKP